MTRKSVAMARRNAGMVRKDVATAGKSCGVALKYAVLALKYAVLARKSETMARKREGVVRRIMLLCLLALVSVASVGQKRWMVKLRAMTFNIRTDSHADGRNNWEMRYLKVADFLEKSKSDIVGLQEVKDNQLQDLATRLTDYGFVGQARDDGKRQGEYNPIFYKKNRFNLLRSGTFWLSPNSEEPSLGWDAAYKRIATWAILQDKATMKSVVVVNTHLDHVGALSRVNGASLIKERVSRMTNELPIILMGDLNTTYRDPVYAKILNGYFPMQDTHKVAEDLRGPAETFNGFGLCKDDERIRKDFIFVTTKVRVRSERVWPSALKHGFYLSDHNAVSADLVF